MTDLLYFIIIHTSISSSLFESSIIWIIFLSLFLSAICLCRSHISISIKSLRSRTAAGKSVIFQWAILVGYICGITHKLLYSMDIVLALYILNFLMVATDTILIYRNRRLDKLRAQEAPKA